MYIQRDKTRLGTWSKNYLTDCEHVNVMSVRILSFNAIHSEIKKHVSQNVQLLSEMAYFIFGYFSTELGKSIDGHEQIII
jgi:hypothetical protein